VVKGGFIRVGGVKVGRCNANKHLYVEKNKIRKGRPGRGMRGQLGTKEQKIACMGRGWSRRCPAGCRGKTGGKGAERGVGACSCAD